jgi:hypothetical protein
LRVIGAAEAIAGYVMAIQCSNNQASQFNQNQLAGLGFGYDSAYQARMKNTLEAFAARERASLEMAAITGMYSTFLGRPGATYTCRYCKTTRQDKNHNCKNCAGLETE